MEKIQPIGRMTLRNVRVAFAQGIFEPQKVDETSTPRYGASFLIPKNDPQVKAIVEKMKAVAAEKWKPKADATYSVLEKKDMYSVLEKKDKLALHDGDDKPNYDGYPGNWYVSAAAKKDAPPGIYNPDATPFVEGKGLKRIYSGCYVVAAVEFWAQDNQFGQRINATLRGVQFLRDGDSFNAARPAESSEFDDVSEGANAGDFA